MPLRCQRILAIAERDPRRAAALARHELTLYEPKHSADYPWLGYTCGWALVQWERFDAARPHLHGARARFAAHGLHVAALRCDYALLLADLLQHAPARLEQEFAALAAQFEQAGAAGDAALTWMYQAALMNVQVRPREAMAVLDRIEPAIAQASRADQARFLYLRGTAEILCGEYAHADGSLVAAEQIFAALHNPLERAKCWFQQAWAALRQEKLELALIGYRRAEQVFARLDLPVRLAFSAKNIGLLLTRMGAYDDALRELLSSLRSFSALGRSADIGTCQLNLGNIYFYTGLWDIALAYYGRAEALYAQAGVIGERLFARRNRAMIYHEQGRFDDAHVLLTTLETEARQLGDDNLVADIVNDQAALLASEGQYVEALIRYQIARDLFSKLGNQLGMADCAMEQGWLELRQGQNERAHTQFQFAAPLIEQHPQNRWRTDYGLARCAEARGDAPAALEHYRSANATVAGLRRRLASEITSSSLYLQAVRLSIDSLRFAARHAALQDLLAFSELQRALALQRAFTLRPSAQPGDYQDQIEALRRHIAALLAEGEQGDQQHEQTLDAALSNYGELLLRARHSEAATAAPVDDLAPAAFDLQQLRAQLNRAYGDDWTAVVYILVDDTLLIAVVMPHDLALGQMPYDRTLQRLVMRVSEPAYQLYTYRDLAYHQGRTTRPWDNLHALANRLLPAAAQARMHPEHRLLIVPAGSLHTVPWNALRTDTGWLAEQAIVHLAPSLTIWQSLAARPAPHTTSALLVGCSTFGDRAIPLPEVADELASVAEHWPGNSELLTGEQASRAELLERSRTGALAQCGLLHIASHAQLHPNRGLVAHVKLSDSDLWLAEVAGLSLGGALVALSACDGAAASPLPGEEVLSLSWAFLAAGAGGVLASLWPVDDQAARYFMGVFYAALRQHGDAGLALVQAQRRMILRYARDQDVLAEPLGWGSFVLTAGSHRLW